MANARLTQVSWQTSRKKNRLHVANTHSSIHVWLQREISLALAEPATESESHRRSYTERYKTRRSQLKCMKIECWKFIVLFTDCFRPPRCGRVAALSFLFSVEMKVDATTDRMGLLCQVPLSS